LSSLESSLNVRRSRLETVLKLLEVDGAIARDPDRPSAFIRTATPWTYDAERVERVTGLREAEVEQMREYMAHRGCLMLFLTSALDDPNREPCGRCMGCSGEPPSPFVDDALLQKAVDFLRRSRRSIGPRLLWPRGAVEGLHGRIPHPNEPGWALSIYGDAGWGRRVAEAKYENESFGPDVIEAAVELIRGQWQPRTEDGWWITSIPSRRRTRLVADAASAIAGQLGLPYRDDVISKTVDAPPQRQMQNSVTQLQNAHASIGLVEMPLNGPVILIDDIVDSRWTITVTGHLLRSHGSGPVHPFAFAEAGGQGS
jgi:ATP-dependent DNA helicase RecQ